MPSTKQNKYLLKDASQDERLKTIHGLTNEHFGGLVPEEYHETLDAHLQKGINVLDIACGTGQWMVEMAQKYPNSQFTGIDITNNEGQNNLYPNVKFLVGDALQVLPKLAEKNERFELVSIRFVMPAFGVEAYSKLCACFSKVQVPGDFFIHIDMLGEYKDAPQSLQKMSNALNYELVKAEKSPRLVEAATERFERAGYKKILSKSVNISFDARDEKTGLCFADVQVITFNNIIENLGNDKYGDLLQPVIKDLSSGNYHPYCQFSSTLAIKN